MYMYYTVYNNTLLCYIVKYKEHNFQINIRSFDHKLYYTVHLNNYLLYALLDVFSYCFYLRMLSHKTDTRRVFPQCVFAHESSASPGRAHTLYKTYTAASCRAFGKTFSANGAVILLVLYLQKCKNIVNHMYKL